MRRLPLEVLLMIFEKIGFIKLIELRLICKDWKSIIDNNKIIKELIIVGECSYRSQKKNKTIIYLDQFKLGPYEILRKIFGSYILHDLKYLNYSFKCNLVDKNQLIHFNCFRLLEQLVLKIYLEAKRLKFILVHPNVKFLSVTIHANCTKYNGVYIDYKGFYMEINCPKCEKLKIGGHFKITDYDIIYPERIKIFKLANDFDHDEYEIDKFTNIEQLEIGTYYLHSPNKIISKLDLLNKLKKIKFKYKDFNEYYGENNQIVKNIRNLLCDLIDNDLISEKQIQIFLNDEEINNKRQIQELIDQEIGYSLDSGIQAE